MMGIEDNCSIPFYKTLFVTDLENDLQQIWCNNSKGEHMDMHTDIKLN